MEIDKETERQIQELQLLENSMQSLMMQKQSFQMEFSEIENALGELEKTKEDVFKIVGSVMIKAKKDELVKELKEKKELLQVRIKSLDSQEEKISSAAENLRAKVLAKIQN